MNFEQGLKLIQEGKNIKLPSWVPSISDLMAEDYMFVE